MSTVVEFQTKAESGTPAEEMAMRFYAVMKGQRVETCLDAVLSVAGMLCMDVGGRLPDADPAAIAEGFGEMLVSTVMAMLAAEDGEEFPAH